MDAFQNPMFESNECDRTFDDFCQEWLLHNTLPASQLEFPKETASALLPIPFGAAYPGASSSNPINSFYQDRLLSTPEPTFHPEPSLQPETFEQDNRALGKRPMLDAHIQFENHVCPVHNRASTSKAVELFDTTTDSGPEFEKHVEDSWAYISKLYSRKKKSAEVSFLKTQRNVRPRRSYQFVKSNTTLVVFGEEMNISEMPTPICSCTGIPRACRGWTTEGWTSICCTASLSMYPLPTYVRKNRMIRLPGRRMGGGTFTRVIEELLLEGYDLDYPIDLKDHWVKLGTNNYAVIK